VIVILLGGLYARYSDHPVVRHAFSGLAAAAAALVAAMAVRIAWPERHSPAGLALAGLAVLAIAVLRLPLLPTLAVLAPLGVLAMHRFGPRA
jgi:chromate transporter